MFSTISLATRGRIIPAGKKRALALATLGWILVSAGPQPPQPIEPPQAAVSGGGVSPGYYYEEVRLKRLLQDDDELLAMIQIFLKSQP